MNFVIVLFLILSTATAYAQAPRLPEAATGTVAYSQGVGVIGVARNTRVSYQTDVTIATAAAGAFTCAATNICTKASHGYYTGLKAAVTTSAGDLPDPLTATDYWVIRIDASTFYLAESSALAQAGTAVDITDTGTGTHTITPAALGGASVKLQGSVDCVDYVDLPIKASGDATKSNSVTATASFMLSENDLNLNCVRLYYTLTAGQIAYSQIYKVQP